MQGYHLVTDFKIEGADKLRQQFKKLDSAVGMRVLSSAASYAMTPVAAAARRAAPVGDKAHKTYRGRTVAPGFLKRNIRKKTKRWRNKKGVTVMVGPTKEAYYGKFAEFGKNKKHKQAKRPWLEPAFEGETDKVMERFASRLKDKIQAATR